MASTASEAVVARRGSASAEADAAVPAAAAAWLCAIPCAAIAVVIVLLLGPPLGRLLSPKPGSVRFLLGTLPFVAPEPTEHARYLLAVCAPLLGVLALALAPRWASGIPRRAVAWAARWTQVALAVLVAAAIVAQYRLRYGPTYSQQPGVTFAERYFAPATLAAAALLAAAVANGLRTPVVRGFLAARPSDSATRRVLAGAAALAATAVWMLHAVHTDAEIGDALLSVRYHLGFVLDETFAVLNGRTPLVDFTAQYGSLWPYAIAIPMAVFGKSVLTFTIVLCAITTLALLAVYGVLRRVTRNSAAALLLYLPFLATSLFLIRGTLRERLTPGSYYGTFPLRYALPFLLAWLTARRIARGRDDATGLWLLFVVAWLTAIDNSDFGVPALGGTVAALLWAAGGDRRRVAWRLGAAALAGLLTAAALVSLLTLLRAGALPQPERIVDYARLFAIGGWGLMPIHGVLGVHTLVYLTYVAAILVATVRARSGASDRVLTGMLAWTATFGLGAGAYYVGRSHPESLPHEFAAWAFALALLTVVAVRELAGPRRSPSAIGAFVVLFGFGVAACSLAQTPMPWTQVERLQAAFVATEEEPYPEPLRPAGDAATRRFVASIADGPSRFVVRRGAPVAILVTTGHRIADAYGVVDVSPYTGILSLPSVERVEAVIDALRRAGGNTLILPAAFPRGMLRVLDRRGFQLLTASGLRRVAGERTKARPVEVTLPSGEAVMKWVDARHLHPRWLGG